MIIRIAIALMSLAIMSQAGVASADTATYVLGLKGMDCAGCEKKITEALGGVEGMGSIEKTSFALQKACVKGDGLTEDSLRATIAGIGYELTSVETVEECPPDLRPGAKAAVWSDTEGLDASIVSRGDKVKLKDIAVAGKYTVVDFGAPWCGPCHKVEAELKTYLRAHDDTAVRAVNLDAADPMASFALPVAQQHLKFASGLPYFIVLGPKGKKVYSGQSLEEAMSAIATSRGDS